MPEFIGPGQEDISFNIRLDASLGVNPEEELQKLRDMRDTGEVSELIIGGKPVTDNPWVLQSMYERPKSFSGSGQLITVDVEIALKEYLRLSESGWEV